MAKVQTKIEITGDSSKYERSMRNVRRSTRKTSQDATKYWGHVGRSVTKITGLLGVLGGVLGGITLAGLAKGATETASAFEDMEIKLDALTKGKGVETLEEINAWAMKMPVNTQKTVDSFAKMVAYGLDPTFESMTTLVDVSSIFGDEVLPRVSRALGQMSAKGKISAQDLNQLSEVGINARKYLRNAFGMTVEEIQKSGAAIEEVIDVIWEGMNQDFGGAAKLAMKSWRGLTTIIKSYYVETQRLTMKAGPMDAMKMVLGEIVVKLDELRDAGDLDEFAREVGTNIVNVIANVVEAIGWMPTAFYAVKEPIYDILSFMTAMSEKVINLIAITEMLVKPWKAMELSLRNNTETWDESMKRVFPHLAKLKAELPALGEAQARAAFTAGMSAEKYAQWGFEIEKLAGKIRKIPDTIAGKRVEITGKLPDTGQKAGGITLPVPTLAKEGKIDPGLKDMFAAWQAEETKRLEQVAEFNEQYAMLGKSRFELDKLQVLAEGEMWAEAGAKRVEVEQLTTSRIAEIRKKENAQKLADIQGVTGNMADNFKMVAEMGGKHSKEAFAMYKAFKITETIISTYSGAMKAYEAMVGIPVVGPALAAAAAGMTVAFGLAQVAMIKNSQMPTYDQGGISTSPGVYYAGVPEAHIPLQGGSIPVQIRGNNQPSVVIMMRNPVFQDLNTQRQVFAQIAEVVAERVAPGAVVRNYQNDGIMRRTIRGGG